MEVAASQAGLTRRCVQCGNLRAASLSVCPEDGAELADVVQVDASAERSISIDISTRAPSISGDESVDPPLPPGTRVGDYLLEERKRGTNRGTKPNRGGLRRARSAAWVGQSSTNSCAAGTSVESAGRNVLGLRVHARPGDLMRNTES